MLALAHDDELDTGPRRPGELRHCAATGKVTPVADMIRFVVGPDGTPVPDLKRRLPGRGLWVTATRAALRVAVGRKVFARGFKRDVHVTADLVETTERLLARFALDALAIASKAGRVTAGFAQVEAAIARNNVIAIVHAAEAAADGTRKLDATLRRRFGPVAAEMPVIRAYTTAQLDLALGRSNVIHAALLAGPACDTFLTRTARLDRFRAGAAGTAEGSRKTGI